MKRKQSTHWVLSGLILLLGCTLQAAEDEQTNPYQSIPERNAFNLKPPPDPLAAIPPPPPVPLAKVTLTGVTSIFGPTDKRAFLEIEETEPGPGPGKGQQKNIRKPIMKEGDREGDIEVISIDLENYTVKIRNGSVETNLVFEEPKMAAATATPVPGLPNVRPVFPGVVPPHTGVRPGLPGIPVPTATPTVTPTIISRGSPYGSGAAATGGTVVQPATTPTRAPFPYRPTSVPVPTTPTYRR